jgi:predicted deacylase
VRTEVIELSGSTPGSRHTLTALHFGQPGRGPKACIQAALHADEVPAMLVAQRLRSLLQVHEAAGEVLGEVTLVPYANPIGLGQEVLGTQQGRFDLRDGVNFNRNLPDLCEAAAVAVAGRLGNDALANVVVVREALRQALAAVPAPDLASSLKQQLMRWAVDADIVLDLHCDAQAAVHLYGLTPQAELCAELGALLGAKAVLMATESGDSPFDEACSRPWFVVQQRHAAFPLPLSCFSTTVELRGQADTSHALAQQDAQALIQFLRRRGVLAGPPAALPQPLCQPTPLAASEPITAPCSGVVVFHVEPGETVLAGQCVLDIVDVDTGQVRAVHAQSAGVLYARIATRWARAGQRLAKVAGSTLLRTGKLLGA